MWIKKQAWERWTKDVGREIAGLRDRISVCDGVIAGQRNEIHDLRVALKAAQTETRTLLERTVNERIEAAAARAYSDLWRVRVNHLEAQNADLLARVLAGYQVPVPQVVTEAVMTAPGVDFEDMGDELAAKHGYTDAAPLPGEPLPQSAVVPSRSFDDGLERVDDPTLLSGLEEEG